MDIRRWLCVHEQASVCVYSLQCFLSLLLKAFIKRFEGLCHQDPEHPWIRSKYHPSSLHILLSVQQSQ